MSNRVTIQDIADALNLSRNTVSKALNNSEGPSDATKARVLAKAVEMGYKQFAYANTLLGSQIGLTTDALVQGARDKGEIALLTTTYLAAPHFSSLMLDGIQRELALLGYTLNSHRVTEDDMAQLRLPLTFNGDRTAAIICIEMFNRAYDEMVCGLGIPTLFVDGPAQHDGWALPSDLLLMENRTQVTKLVCDMLAQGRKRIGFIGNWLHCESFYERYSAFRLAMLMSGVEVEPQLCIRQNYAQGIKEGIESSQGLPDLFICANDFVALDALQAIRELGYDVPLDVALAGFDDSAESRRCMPPLTTIHIHTQSMAYSAVQLLRTRIKEPALDYRQVYAETELIYRASTDPGA